MKGLVLTPLRAEQAIARSAFQNRSDIRVFRIGMGPDAATTSTRRIFSDEKPDWCLLAGFCAGLSPDLATGTIVAPSPMTAQSDGALLIEPDVTMTERAISLGARRARSLTVDRFIATPREKSDLRRRHGADVLDMESASVALAAREFHIPFLALRCVLDDSTRDLTSLTELMRSHEPSGWDALAHAMFHPRSLGSLVRLAADHRRASRALKNMLGAWAE